MNDTEILPGTPPWPDHHRFTRVNGVRLHCVETLPQSVAANGSESPSVKPSAPLCLLLHGFPEFWYSWRHQLPALAAAGFHALAPDLRGYNLSDKPPGVDAYRLDKLLGDVLGLIHEVGAERATVVGHDWGGVIAWQLAMQHPQVIEKLIILNAPHPRAYFRELRSWRQLLKSWYIFFFQLPALPEQMIAAGDFEFLDRLLRHRELHLKVFTKEDIRLYKQALARPGALTAALNYYRALRHSLPRALHEAGPVQAPTLVLWGERDSYLSLRLTEGLDAWVPNLRMVRLPDVSHWIQNEVPEQVNRLMIDFLHGIPVAS